MTRKKIVERLRRVYARVRRKKHKSRVLNEYGGVTGISRKHAILQLHGGRQRHGGRGGRRGRPVPYDRRLAEPLHVLWRAAGYCCAALLHAARERLLQQLRAHGRLVGCRRYDTQEQCDLLNEVYALDDVHVNYWSVPMRKWRRR